MITYDCIILGGGPGGYTAAAHAGNQGLSVLLIEGNQIGGVCLNSGCIPSKSWLHTSKLIDAILSGPLFGVSVSEISVYPVSIRDRKNQMVSLLRKGISAKLRASQVEVKEGFGYIEKVNDDVIIVRVGEESFSCLNLIIATGSEAIIPDIQGVEEGIQSGRILDNSTIFDLPSIPKTIAIVGAGAIGLEMASYFASMKSKVTVIDLLDHIANNVDSEISTLLQKEYEARGIEFFLKAKAQAVTPEGLTIEQDGKQLNIQADNILLCAGRKPNSLKIGLEKAEIQTERDFIITDNKCRTSSPRIFAIGDVIGKQMLAHVASREGEVAVNTIMNIDDELRYDIVPMVIYATPEVASVGLTEEDATKLGITASSISLPFNYSGRYVVETNHETSICKLIVDQSNTKIIGCHLMGNYSSELITIGALIVQQGMTIEQVKRTIFPHPTVAEIISETVMQYRL